MKKLILLILFVSGPVLLLAQGPVSFGPKVGFNTTRLTTDYTEYLQDIKSGGQLGLFFSIYMDKVYIQPEVYLSLKRGTLDTTIENPWDPANSLQVRQTMSLTTVDIPMLLGYKLLDLKLARLRVWGGPVASYVLDKQLVLELDGLDESDRISADDFKDATWGVQFGAGLDLLSLTFDVGYEFGLENFASLSGLNDLNLRNNLFFCSIGWRLF